MNKLSEILSFWEIDSEIDRTSPDTELLNIPKLHNKYLKILSQHRLLSHKAKFEYSRMKKIRREYFLGALDQETLQEFGWEQFDLKLGNKQNIDIYLESDDYLIKLMEKKTYHDEIIFVCESILKELQQRTWQLREYIGWQRFTNGS